MMKQKAIKRIQRRLQKKKDELDVHLSHLSDMVNELDVIVDTFEKARGAVERAMAEIERC